MCVAVRDGFEHVGEVLGYFFDGPCVLTRGLVMCGFVAYVESHRHIATQGVHGGVERMIVNERHVAFS